MCHPTEVQQAWDDLTPFPQPHAPADYPTVDDLVAAVIDAETIDISMDLADAGWKVRVEDDGTVYAEQSTVDPDTNDADGLRFRIVREA